MKTPSREAKQQVTSRTRTEIDVSVREICENYLHGLKESVAITLPTNVGRAILLGVARAIC